MPRSKSSKQWLREHFSDQYVKQAQAKGYRSRAAFKLIEIQDKDKLILPGMVIIDLGAAPGGWSQVAVELVGERGHVYALDILPIEPLANVDIIQGDFTEQKILDQLINLIGDVKADLVISDMAPNISGIDEVDQPKSMYLAELALDAAKTFLKPQGNFLVKVFQGTGFEAYLYKLRSLFSKVVTRKPSASRARSREVYLVCRGFLGKN